ncbi:MAG: hypothetical protein V3T41_02730 [bacterium]
MRRRALLLVLSFAVGASAASGAAEWRNAVNRTYVSDVLVDGDAVWLSYLGGGVARYEPRTGKATYYTAADGLIHNSVTAAAADKNKLYFASRNGLAAFSRADGAFERTVRMWGFAHNDCTDVAADERYVYVSTLEGARRYDKTWPGKEFEPIPPEVGPASRLSPQVEDGWKVFITPDDLYSVTLTEEAVYWGGRGRLFASTRGAEGWREVAVELPVMAAVRRVLTRGATLVVATDEGVFEYDGSRTTRAPGPPGRVDARDAFAFAGLEYYATEEGLFVRRADGRPFKFAAGAGSSWKKLKDSARKKSPAWRLGAADGLPSPRCTALASWGESIIIGTENGACVLEPTSGQVRPLPLAKGLPPGGVYAVAYGDGRIWAATPNGLAAVDEADFAVEKFELPGGWNDVRDVAFFDGEMLITSRPGLISVPGNGREPKTFDLRIRKGTGEGICAVKIKDYYILGTTTTLLPIYKMVLVDRSYCEGEDFPPHPVRALLPWQGKLLVGTLGRGLTYIDLPDRVVSTLRAGAGISSDALFSLAADDEHIYVGTYDKGVDVLDAALNFEKNISWGDGLSHTDIWAAAADPPWLWLAIRGVGVNAYHLETGEVRRYYARYGLGDEYCKSIAVLPPREGRKRLAFGTASGVAVLSYDGEPPDYAEDDYDRNYP